LANAGRKIETQKTFNYRRNSLGAGFVFVDSVVLWEEFATAGISYQGFLAWLRSMGVPCVHVGKKRIVRLQSFKLGLLAASQIGRPDFLTPGCSHLKKKGAKFNMKHYTTRLDPDYIRENMSVFVEELLLSKASAGYFLTEEVRELANSVVDTYITEAARLAPILAAQREADGRSLSKRRILKGPSHGKATEQPSVIPEATALNFP